MQKKPKNLESIRIILKPIAIEFGNIFWYVSKYNAEETKESWKYQNYFEAYCHRIWQYILIISKYILIPNYCNLLECIIKIFSILMNWPIHSANLCTRSFKSLWYFGLQSYNVYSWGLEHRSSYLFCDSGSLGFGVVQEEGLTVIADLFKEMNLHFNTNKTKTRVHYGGSGSQHEWAEAHACHFDHSLPAHWQRAYQKVSCPQCQKHVSLQPLW